MPTLSHFIRQSSPQAYLRSADGAFLRVVWDDWPSGFKVVCPACNVGAWHDGTQVMSKQAIRTAWGIPPDYWTGLEYRHASYVSPFDGHGGSEFAHAGLRLVVKDGSVQWQLAIITEDREPDYLNTEWVGYYEPAAVTTNGSPVGTYVGAVTDGDPALFSDPISIEVP
jgi:hypothetical protein